MLLLSLSLGFGEKRWGVVGIGVGNGVVGLGRRAGGGRLSVEGVTGGSLAFRRVVRGRLGGFWGEQQAYPETGSGALGEDFGGGETAEGEGEEVANWGLESGV